MSIFQTIGNAYRNNIVYVDKRRRSLTSSLLVAKHFKYLLRLLHDKSEFNAEIVTLLYEIQKKNADFDLIFGERLDAVVTYLKNNKNICNKLLKLLLWVYENEKSFVLSKCFFRSELNAWISKPYNYISIHVVCFRFVACQMLQFYLNNLPHDSNKNAKLISEYAVSHYPFLQHVIECEDASDNSLLQTTIQARGLQTTTNIFNFLDPIFHCEDSSSKILDITLLLTSHDHWWQCLQNSTTFENSNDKDCANRHAKTANSILTIIRKTQGQRCQVRGLTKTIQKLIASNKTVYDCVYRWLWYTLFGNHTHHDEYNLSTQTLIQRIFYDAYKTNNTFLHDFFTYFNKSSATQTFLVCMMREIVKLYADIDILLCYKIKTHTNSHNNDIRICQSLSAFRSLFNKTIMQRCDYLFSLPVDVAIKETMGIINDCTEQIFLQPAYRLQSVVCYYTLHNWSWFEYCKDCIQRETVPHADILRLQVDFSSSTLINMDASCFPRLTREHSRILLQILAFYSKAYSIIKSTNFQNCTSIYERLKCTFDTLHCSSQLRLAICSCVMQQERSEKMLCKICKKNKEEWKAWIIFSVLDQQVSYQEFHLNSRLVKAQMSTAKRLFPENYKIKIRQKYQFCTSCPSNISMKHDCKHAECLHSAMLGQVNRTELNEVSLLNKAVCMQTKQSICMRWKKMVSNNNCGIPETDSKENSKQCHYKITSMLSTLACMLHELKATTLIGKIVTIRSTSHVLCCGCLYPIMFVTKPTLFGEMLVCKDCYIKMAVSNSYSNYKTCAYCSCDLNCKSIDNEDSSTTQHFAKQWIMHNKDDKFKLRRIVFCKKHAPKHFMRRKSTKIGLLRQIYKVQHVGSGIKKYGHYARCLPRVPSFLFILFKRRNDICRFS